MIDFELTSFRSPFGSGSGRDHLYRYGKESARQGYGSIDDDASRSFVRPRPSSNHRRRFVRRSVISRSNTHARVDARLSSSTTEEALIIEDVKAFSTIQIQLPILEISHDVAIDVNIVAEYFTSKRPTTRRTLRRAASYPVALPLAVTVQDFFRKDW